MTAEVEVSGGLDDIEEQPKILFENTPDDELPVQFDKILEALLLVGKINHLYIKMQNENFDKAQPEMRRQILRELNDKLLDLKYIDNNFDRSSN